MTNLILENPFHRDFFADWVNDYTDNMGHYPGSFVVCEPWGEEIEYSESDVWEAIEAMTKTGEIKPLDND